MSESDTSLYLCNVEKTKEMLLLDKAKNSSLYNRSSGRIRKEQFRNKTVVINNKTNKKEKVISKQKRNHFNRKPLLIR